VIREHTVIGERILRSVPEMAEVATIVRHSHEHWDGSGYPDGLAGEQIPLASRVILCADAYHAIRSDRPYRAGRSAGEAMAEVRRSSGTNFDPEVVRALERVAADVRRGGLGVALPRRKRLVALLATLAIGTSTAVAAIPDVRSAVRSLFAADTVPTHVVPYAPGSPFMFGPFGNETRIGPPARDRAAGERGETRSSNSARGGRRTPGGARRSDGSRGSRRSDGRGSFRDGGSRETLRRSGIDGSRGGRTRSAPNPPTSSGGSGSGTTRTGSGGAGGGGGTTPVRTDSAPTGGAGTGTGDGPGRGLGHTLPTPRRPAVPPRQNGTAGIPENPGRVDPPAIGRNNGPAVHVPGKG
jgi:hypothetical protein